MLKKISQFFLLGTFLIPAATAMDDYSRYFSYFNSPSQSSKPDTQADLNTILKTDFISLDDCFGHINLSEADEIAALKQGRDLFERTLLIEKLANESGYAIWWRFTLKGLDEDVVSTKTDERSFGISLLAGYMEDGYINYGDAGFLGDNMSACTYIYYANSLFIQTLLEKRLTLAKRFAQFIKENNFFSNAPKKVATLESIIVDLTDRYAIFQEKKEKGELASYLRETSAVGEKSEMRGKTSDKEYQFLLELVQSIQKDPNFQKMQHLNTVTSLYRERLKLYGTQEEKITQNALGNLFAVLMPHDIEKKLLQESKWVLTGKQAVLYGRGEGFHPRMPLSTYAQLKDNTITVYQNLSLISFNDLSKKLDQIKDSKK